MTRQTTIWFLREHGIVWVENVKRWAQGWTLTEIYLRRQFKFHSPQFAKNPKKYDEAMQKIEKVKKNNIHN